MQTPAHRPHVWTRIEYEQLIGSGGFVPGSHLELIEGEILDMAPQQSRHSTGVRLVEEALRVAFGSGFDVRSQLPLAIDDEPEPEPDITVVADGPRDYRDRHPSTALLTENPCATGIRVGRRLKGSAAFFQRDLFPPRPADA